MYKHGFPPQLFSPQFSCVALLLIVPKNDLGPHRIVIRLSQILHSIRHKKKASQILFERLMKIQ